MVLADWPGQQQQSSCAHPLLSGSSTTTSNPFEEMSSQGWHTCLWWQRWLHSFILLIDSTGLGVRELRKPLLLMFKVIWILLALFKLAKIQILSECALLDCLGITVLLFLYSQKLLILLLRLNLVQNELLSRVLVLLE